MPGLAGAGRCAVRGEGAGQRLLGSGSGAGLLPSALKHCPTRWLLLPHCDTLFSTSPSSLGTLGFWKKLPLSPAAGHHYNPSLTLYLDSSFILLWGYIPCPSPQRLAKFDFCGTILGGSQSLCWVLPPVFFSNCELSHVGSGDLFPPSGRRGTDPSSNPDCQWGSLKGSFCYI